MSDIQQSSLNEVALELNKMEQIKAPRISTKAEVTVQIFLISAGNACLPKAFVLLPQAAHVSMFVWNKSVWMSNSAALLSDIASGCSRSLSLSVCLTDGQDVQEAFQLQSAESPWNSAKPLPEFVVDTQLYSIPHSPLALNVTTGRSIQGLILGTKWGRKRATPRCMFPSELLMWFKKRKKREYTIKNGTWRCQLISSRHTRGAQKLISSLSVIQFISFHLLLSVPGLMWEEISWRAEAAHTMGETQPPPNLILQQMAKCNLWPWQIAVLVKPSSTLQKKKKKVREADGWGWEESKRGGRIQKWKRQNTWERQRDGEKVELNTRKECEEMWRRSESFECWVKLDRFEGDQQSERLWVKLEWVKTHERDVKKHERPIKCRFRIATRGAKRDETRSGKNNSKPDDNCERCPLITCHVWCRW